MVRIWFGPKSNGPSLLWSELFSQPPVECVRFRKMVGFGETEKLPSKENEIFSEQKN